MPWAWWAPNQWGASTRGPANSGAVQQWVRKGSRSDAYSEQCDEEEGGAEGRAGEAAEGEEEEDDSEEGYESPEDPFPREARRRPTKEDLDKDFDPNEEVGKKP